MKEDTAREFIEWSRELARKSRDLMLPSLRTELAAMRLAGVKEEDVKKFSEHAQNHRMDLVMDCFLTGDDDPDQWKEDFDHEARLRELFERFHLKRGSI